MRNDDPAMFGLPHSVYLALVTFLPYVLGYNVDLCTQLMLREPFQRSTRDKLCVVPLVLLSTLSTFFAEHRGEGPLGALWLAARPLGGAT